MTNFSNRKKKTNNYKPIIRRSGTVEDISKYILPIFIFSSLIISKQPGLNRITIAIGFLVSMGYTLYHIATRKTIQTEVLIYLVWVVWASLGAFVCLESGYFWEKYFTVTMIFIMIFTIAGISFANKDIKLNMISIIISSIFIFLHSYFTEEISGVFDVSARIRAGGLLGNSNTFGISMVYGTFAIMYFWKENLTVAKKWFIYSIVIIFIIGIIASGSRKSFIGELLFFIFWIGFCYRRIMFRSVIGLIGISIIIVGFYVMVEYTISNTYLGERITDAPEAINEREGGIGHRLRFYEMGLGLISENPIIGVGLNQFRFATGTSNYSHSDYIAVAVSTGLVGFAIYYSFYLILWMRLQWIIRRTSNQVILYRVGLAKASILVILFLAIGVVSYYSKIVWIYLASIAGYTWFIETEIQKVIKNKKRDSVRARRIKIRKMRESKVINGQY
ncbi:O-antigen ligase family protein [bacterium]|nr:O-antigen ligase family protein [bacterium]